MTIDVCLTIGGLCIRGRRPRRDGTMRFVKDANSNQLILDYIGSFKERPVSGRVRGG